MNKRIQTYDDLLKEKQQLEILLQAQKELIRYDIKDVKAGIQQSVSSAGKIFTRDTTNLLLTSGANRLIDIVVKHGILGRAGWVLRFLVPFALKNYSSHYIADHKNQWFRKLFSWIGNRNGKTPKGSGQTHY